jgi:hypothetical protein
MSVHETIPQGNDVGRWETRPQMVNGSAELIECRVERIEEAHRLCVGNWKRLLPLYGASRRDAVRGVMPVLPGRDLPGVEGDLGASPRAPEASADAGVGVKKRSSVIRQLPGQEPPIGSLPALPESGQSRCTTI